MSKGDLAIAIATIQEQLKGIKRTVDEVKLTIKENEIARQEMSEKINNNVVNENITFATKSELTRAWGAIIGLGGVSALQLITILLMVIDKLWQ